jgi:sulfopyruvate decarboxylase subunit beta
MKRKEAIKSIFDTIDQSDITVSTTGLISREIFSEFDSPRNIYVPGSMGLVSSIGLAIALCHSDKRVVVIDGDASLLMNLGSMVTIGANAPDNFMHIVLDNGAYGSCSEEESLSSFANFAKIAKDVGYRHIRIVRSVSKLRETILYEARGPVFILVKIKLGGRRDFSRPLELVKIKIRFMNFLLTNKN